MNIHYRIRRLVPGIWKKVIPFLAASIDDAIVFEGNGYRKLAGLYCKESGYSRVLIVTDKNLVMSGIVDDVINSLEEQGIVYDIYDEVSADVRTSTISAAAFVGRSVKADCVIAVGGGSSIDCAKMTACALAAPKVPMTILNTWLIGPTLFRHKPIISIPTTGGSGAETAFCASVISNETHIKHISGGPNLKSEVAFLDPETLTNCSPEIMAYSGMDALSHGLEAYLSHCAKTKTQRDNAIKCIMLSMKNLKSACLNPGDEVAKRNMLLAANFGGRARNYCLGGYNQAFAHAIGMTYYMRHGNAVSITMVANLRFLKDIREKDLSNLALWLGIGDKSKSDSYNAEVFICSVEKLIKDIGLDSLRSIIKPLDYAFIIEQAFSDSMNYPLPKVMTIGDAVKLLNESSDGLEVKEDEINDDENRIKVFRAYSKNKDLFILTASTVAGISILTAGAFAINRYKARKDKKEKKKKQ